VRPDQPGRWHLLEVGVVYPEPPGRLPGSGIPRDRVTPAWLVSATGGSVGPVRTADPKRSPVHEPLPNEPGHWFEYSSADSANRREEGRV